jgi:hypothetical protein
MVISFILLIFVLVSFFLLKLTMRFMIKIYWPLSMLLKNGVIYLKEFNMKSLCTPIIRTFNISWLLVFWINTKFDGHCPCFGFRFVIHIAFDTNKGNLMCCPVVHTSHLRGDMQPTNNNVMSLSSLNIFDFKCCW